MAAGVRTHVRSPRLRGFILALADAGERSFRGRRDDETVFPRPMKPGAQGPLPLSSPTLILVAVTPARKPDAPVTAQKPVFSNLSDFELNPEAVTLAP